MARDSAQARFRRLHRWIALTAMYEELIVRIAQEVHKSYKKNQIFDDSLLDLCRSMDELFEHAQHYQKELEADLGSNRWVGFIGRLFIMRNVSRYKRLVAEQAQELGIRAMNTEARGFTDSKKVIALCKRARRCRESADTAWEAIVKAYNQASDEKVSALEAILGKADKLSQRLLTNRRLRGLLGSFISYKDEDRDSNLDESERLPIYEQEETATVRMPAIKRETSSTWLGEQPPE